MMIPRNLLLIFSSKNNSMCTDASKRPFTRPEEEVQTTLPRTKGEETVAKGWWGEGRGRDTGEKRPLGGVGFRVRNVSLLLPHFDQRISEGGRV